MANQFDVVVQLTSGQLRQTDRLLRLNEFARDLGWRPSDDLDPGLLTDIATAQLLVEHGLENSAVLTFLRAPNQYPTLGTEPRQALLATSYNNLVDWHITIEAGAITYIYVRSLKDTFVERRLITRDDYDSLRSEMFDQVIGRRPSANFPALDDALIRTISLWKRNLAADVPAASNSALSHLFNALIFVRALEDNRRRTLPNSDRALLRAQTTTEPRNIASLLQTVLAELVGTVPTFLFDTASLQVFNNLEPSTVRALIGSFYDNRYAPYPYDFAVISKHALSRIYEHYVALLRHDPTAQLHLLPELPSEYLDRRQGAVYTPQFIARFFARYLRENTTPYQFKRLKTTDPACGSGIFLRTLLEFQCDPMADGLQPELIAEAFKNTAGVDRDPNAVAATRLSLSLLHLVLTGALPDALPIAAGDITDQATVNTSWLTARDAVLINPPFVRLEHLSEEQRRRAAEMLGGEATGRLDLYLVFLTQGIRMLRPGGFGFFVLPQSFLLGSAAKAVRELVLSECWVRCIADLSAVRVFDEKNVYVVLLIVQRKAAEAAAPQVMVIKCQDLVGHALQDAVEGRRVENRYYSIQDLDQKDLAGFASGPWFLLPPSEQALRARVSTLPRLDSLVRIHQGMVTGADSVFIVDAKTVPDDDPSPFVPLLADREMQAYSTPHSVARRIFFPYWRGEKLTEDALRTQFPRTWQYLERNRDALTARSGLERYSKQWWEPLWPREPGTLQRPKIVTPHLVILPRFALDAKGRFAVTRAPFLVGQGAGDDVDLLKLLLAVLNSRICFWHIQRHAHTYSRGYAKLENRILAATPVPELSAVAPATTRSIIDLVDKRIGARTPDEFQDYEARLDELISRLYGLSAAEQRILGLPEAVAG